MAYTTAARRAKKGSPARARPPVVRRAPLNADFTLHPLRACRDGGPPAPDLRTLLDGALAGGYVQTEPAGSLRCREPVWVGHGEAERRFFHGGRSPADFGADYDYPAGCLAVLRHARLAGKGWVVVAGDHHVITDSFSGSHILEIDGRFQSRTLHVDADGRRQGVSFVLSRRREPERRIPGISILPTHYWHFNYHHWLVECLPRLRCALESPDLAACPVVVPADMAPFQRASLDLLGLAAERRLPFDGGDWRFDTLVFPSIGSFSPAELRWVRRRLVGGRSGGLASDRSVPPEARAPAAAATAKPPAAPTRLYISRADAGTRRLVNEAEVVAALEPLGFEVLTLTGMPLADQIRRFAQAEAIVGPHGSGLTNLLFAPSGCTVVELMPDDRVNHCFWLMANGLGLRYAFLSGSVVSPARDFRVAPERLEAVLAAVLAPPSKA